MNDLTTPEHVFDQAVSLGGLPNKRVSQVDEAYQNMVGPFGGITAAKILQSILLHPEREGSPVSLTLNYLGPINKSDLEINVALLRTNRSNQHWSVEVWQGSEIQCSATCVLANRKDTWHSQEIQCPEAPDFEDTRPLPEFPGMAPWIKQYDLRFVYGSPFDKVSEAKDSNQSESLLWIADKPGRKLDFVSLTSIADAFFPRIIIRRRKMVPAGTVSLTIHFHASEQDLLALESGAVLGHARASKFAGSYFDQTGELWSADRKLLATTSQMVYYKD